MALRLWLARLALPALPAPWLLFVLLGLLGRAALLGLLGLVLALCLLLPFLLALFLRLARLGWLGPLGCLLWGVRWCVSVRLGLGLRLWLARLALPALPAFCPLLAVPRLLPLRLLPRRLRRLLLPPLSVCPLLLPPGWVVGDSQVLDRCPFRGMIRNARSYPPRRREPLGRRLQRRLPNRPGSV